MGCCGLQPASSGAVLLLVRVWDLLGRGQCSGISDQAGSYACVTCSGHSRIGHCAHAPGRVGCVLEGCLFCNRWESVQATQLLLHPNMTGLCSTCAAAASHVEVNQQFRALNCAQQAQSSHA